MSTPGDTVFFQCGHEHEFYNQIHAYVRCPDGSTFQLNDGDTVRLWLGFAEHQEEIPVEGEMEAMA